MPKIILNLIVTGLLFSCKKNYTCECYSETEILVSTHSVKAKKKDAEKECNASNFGYSNRWEGYCKIK